MARYKVYITPDGDQYGFPRQTNDNLYGDALIAFCIDNGYPEYRTQLNTFQVRILDTETNMQKVMGKQ